MDTDVLISYKRDDEPAFVGRLYNLINSAFLHHGTFIDIHRIHDRDDPIFVAVEGEIRREFDELFLGMLEEVGLALARQTEDAGWRF
jgi:hypothetical protein